MSSGLSRFMCSFQGSGYMHNQQGAATRVIGYTMVRAWSVFHCGSAATRIDYLACPTNGLINFVVSNMHAVYWSKSCYIRWKYTDRWGFSMRYVYQNPHLSYINSYNGVLLIKTRNVSCLVKFSSFVSSHHCITTALLKSDITKLGN